MFAGIFKGKKILVTGHSGFKGSWLCLWLRELGAEIHGVSLLTPEQNNHFGALNLDISEEFYDLADIKKIGATIKRFKPDFIMHLAAQSLVRKSYLQPYETLTSNVLGTMNILESLRKINKRTACLIVTTDKCYQNQEWLWGYRETEPLGGKDIYSGSKAMCEILSNSYRESFFGPKNNSEVFLATARAGNVIGGGDWSEDRLVPDVVRATIANNVLDIRYPNATRPWQHVLDCLQGYLTLSCKLFLGEDAAASAWNFGPDSESNKSVKDLLTALKKNGLDFQNTLDTDFNFHEAGNLYLDSTKARKILFWKPIWNFHKTVEMTASWYNSYKEEGVIISKAQLKEYIIHARNIGVNFTRNV